MAERDFCIYCLKGYDMDYLYHYKDDLYVCHRCLNEMIDIQMAERKEWTEKLKGKLL